MAQHHVYSFYAELKDYEPKVWRRFEINGEKTMAELGYALMLMFEMQASHLFCFTENRRDALIADLRSRYSEEEIREQLDKNSMSDFVKNWRYMLADEHAYIGDDEQLIEANKITLEHITHRPGWRFTLEYDFGDGWEVDLELIGCEKREVFIKTCPV